MKLKDRHGNDFCMAPTHEESITATVAQDLSSHKQLPMVLYQIGPKFRDEIRPRFGLLRAREFIMKDMYTFHASTECALETYDKVLTAYKGLMQQLGVPWRVVDADSGNIGGERSQEVHILSPIGEDKLLSCGSDCGYAANVEKAQGLAVPVSEEVTTAVALGLRAIEAKDSQEVAQEKLGTEARVLMFESQSQAGKGAAVVVASGDEVNEVRLADALGAGDLVPARSGHSQSWEYFVDSRLAAAVESPAHSIGEFREIQAGDTCVRGECQLVASEGIEVGHCFFLGTKYSEALGATFTPATGGKKVPCQMGCYGLGVTRLIGAIAEASHDELGLIWPPALAPYRVAVLVLDAKRDEDMLMGEQLASQVSQSGYQGDVCLDERQISPGKKLKDAQLLGYPWVIVIGKSWRSTGQVELQIRQSGSTLLAEPSDIIEKLAL